MASNALYGQVLIVFQAIALSLSLSFFDLEVVMPSTELADNLLEDWEDSPSLGLTELIFIFLDECGEHATWEDWRAFLHKYQEKGFEWIDNVH